MHAEHLHDGSIENPMEQPMSSHPAPSTSIFPDAMRDIAIAIDPAAVIGAGYAPTMVNPAVRRLAELATDGEVTDRFLAEVATREALPLHVALPPLVEQDAARTIEVYPQAELRRMIHDRALDVVHAARREAAMAKPIPVGRGPLADATKVLADLQRRLELRIEQDAGRSDIEMRATGFAAEILLAAGPLRGGAATRAVQQAVWRSLAAIATRVQAAGAQ